MNFTNTMREHCPDNGDLMKAPKVNERSRLRLQLVNGIQSDETLIYFDSNATNDFNEYDSPKTMNNSSVTPDLYSKAGTERLVIDGLREVSEGLELPLGFSLNADASVKLQKYGPNTKINEWELMTFDFSGLIGKTVTKLIIYPDYPSARTAGSINYIDNIFFNPLTSGVNEIITGSIHLYPNPVIDVLHIQLPENNKRLMLYDLIGNKVFDLFIPADYKLNMSNFKTGIYFLKAENAKGITNGKVIEK